MDEILAPMLSALKEIENPKQSDKRKTPDEETQSRKRINTKTDDLQTCREHVNINTFEMFLKSYNCDFNDEIGQGGYGTVYRCTEKNTGNNFALKIFEIEGDAGRDQNRKEAALQLFFSRNNVGPTVPNNFYFEDANFSYIVMELMDGTVASYIKAYLNDSEWDKLETSIFKLMNMQMQQLGMICVDQKPQNMLFKKNPFKVVLSDFDAKFCCSTNPSSSCVDKCKIVYPPEWNLTWFQVSVMCKELDPRNRLMFKDVCYKLYYDCPSPKNRKLLDRLMHYLYSSHHPRIQEIIYAYCEEEFVKLIRFWLDYSMKDLKLALAIKKSHEGASMI